MHRCYSQINIDEPNLLKYESQKNITLKKIKQSSNTLLVNRSISVCHPPAKHPASNLKHPPSNVQLCLALSDDTFVENQLRRTNSKSCLLHASHSFEQVLSDVFVQRTNSEVKLCRKGATTRINMASSQTPPAETSLADALKSDRSKPSTKVELEEKSNDDEVESVVDEDLNVLKVESMPQIKRELKKSSITNANKLPPQIGSNRKDKMPFIIETNQLSIMHYNRQNLSPTQDVDGLKWNKPQLDKIFSRSERFGPCSSHLATDFSRALLQNLLQRGKEASLDFETSEAGTFSQTNSDVEIDQSPTHASVEVLATKIVQRINQVQDNRKSSFHLHTIKNVFDKLIAASPSLSQQLQRLKNLYTTNIQTDDNHPSTDEISDTVASPPSDNYNKLEKLEEELEEQAKLLNKLLAELEKLKEQQNTLVDNLNSEGEALAEMRNFAKLMFSLESKPEAEDNLNSKDGLDN